jgi:hypothetical protein
MLWVLPNRQKQLELLPSLARLGGKVAMHRIIAGVISTTLLSCTFGLAGDQAKNGDKDPSHPPFKVLNGSRANPNITLTELLDSYEKAVGGKEAIEKIRTLVAYEERRAEAKLGEQRYGSSVAYFKFPNKSKSVLTLPGGSKGVIGYDGKIAWYDSPSEGIQRVPSEENAFAAQELNLFNRLHLREVFPQMKLVGSSKVEGRDVYAVYSSVGRSYRDLYFDAETRLLILSVEVQLGVGRTLMTVEAYSDFRVVNGVKFPFAVKGIEFNHENSYEIIRTRIECNIPLGDDFFSVNATTAKEGGS